MRTLRQLLSFRRGPTTSRTSGRGAAARGGRRGRRSRTPEATGAAALLRRATRRH